MIGEITLEALCNQYGIDSSKVIRNNQNVLDFGEYLEIKKVLDYLVKELGISAKNIEKCPSILYLNVNAIKYNYEFLRCHKININNVETCLHILSTNPQELQKTYSYVLNNYGEKYLNSITSILSITVGRIIQIENLFNDCDKSVILSASISRRTIDEIKEIIKVCKENNIKLAGSTFLKSAKQLQNNIDYVKNNYGVEYLTPLIVCKNLKQLQEIMPYLKEKGVLEVLINGATILTLKLDEVKDREEFILSIGETITTNGKFNSIFRLSRKNYQIKKEKYKVIK